MDRGLDHAAKSQEFESFVEGLRLIEGQFKDTLSKYGVERVDAASGREFDPNMHEAVLSLPGDEEGANVIVDEYEKGYTLNSRLLRPAKVSVTRNKDKN